MDQLKTVKLHDLGEGLDGGKLIEWHVNIGDPIKIGDPLASIETAKALVELPSPYTGIIDTLDIHIDTTVETGATLAKIKTNHIKIDSHLPLVGKPAHKNYDLPDESALRQNKEEPLQTISMETQLMVKNMMLSKQVVAATLFDDMPADDFNPNVNITVQIIQKLIQTVRKNPKLNAHFNHQTHELITFEHLDLGIAFNDQDEYLKVPIISHVNDYSQAQLSTMIASIKTNGIHSKYIDHQKSAPTFTLTNIGSIGAKYGTPILIPPTVAILAVGRKEKKPIVKNDKIQIANSIPISLTFDHRILTGAQASKFINDLCN